MKQVILGDIHGRTIWKKIIETEEKVGFDRVIFIGDYFDSFDVPGIEQLNNFLDICAFKRDQIAKGKEVIMLIGNHDHHYFNNIGDTGTSGFQPKMREAFGKAIEENKDLLQMAFEDEYGTVYTHAGVSKRWIEWVKTTIPEAIELNWANIAEAINQLFLLKPSKAFEYNRDDWGGYGDYPTQTPIWIRPDALMGNNILNLQVVGHTAKGSVRYEYSAAFASDGFWLIDNLEAGEYLYCLNGQYEVRQQL